MSDLQKIRHRWTNDMIYECEAPTLGRAVKRAVRDGVSLHGADLQYADLWHADLGDADLRYTDLRGADLQYADFQHADLRDAVLDGARLNWTSHDLISETLWQAADTLGRRMVAAYVGRERGQCWDDFLDQDHPETEWALRTLAGWVHPDDQAPPAVMQYVE